MARVDHLRELARFFDDGPPPLVFTLGWSAAMVAGSFFELSVAAAKLLGRRAVLITGKGLGNRPALLPEGVVAFDYALLRIVPTGCGRRPSGRHRHDGLRRCSGTADAGRSLFARSAGQRRARGKIGDKRSTSPRREPPDNEWRGSSDGARGWHCPRGLQDALEGIIISSNRKGRGQRIK